MNTRIINKIALRIVNEDSELDTELVFPFIGNQKSFDENLQEIFNENKRACLYRIDGDPSKILKTYQVEYRHVREFLENNILKSTNKIMKPEMLLDIFIRLIILSKHSDGKDKYYFECTTLTLPDYLNKNIQYEETPCSINPEPISSTHYQDDTFDNREERPRAKITIKEPTIDVEKRTCVNCSEVSECKMRKCGRCRSVRYCSIECQIEGWKKGHKDVCQPCV